MTNEDFNYFSKYADRFQSAVHSNYARNISSVEMKELVSRFHDLTGIKLIANTSCSRCVLQNFRIIGEVYEEEMYKRLQEQTPEEPKSDVSIKIKDIFTSKNKKKSNGNKR